MSCGGPVSLPALGVSACVQLQSRARHGPHRAGTPSGAQAGSGGLDAGDLCAALRPARIPQQIPRPRGSSPQTPECARFRPLPLALNTKQGENGLQNQLGQRKRPETRTLWRLRREQRAARYLRGGRSDSRRCLESLTSWCSAHRGIFRGENGGLSVWKTPRARRSSEAVCARRGARRRVCWAGCIDFSAASRVIKSAQQLQRALPRSGNARSSPRACTTPSSAPCTSSCSPPPRTCTALCGACWPAAARHPPPPPPRRRRPDTRAGAARRERPRCAPLPGTPRTAAPPSPSCTPPRRGAGAAPRCPRGCTAAASSGRCRARC